MFETFSKKYESSFRIIFIVWVCIWGVANFFTTIFQYVSFSANASGNELGKWWLNTVGNLVGLTIGILLLFFMSNVPARVKAKKALNNIGLLIALTIFYYLFPTFVSIANSAIFNPGDFARDFIFLTAWLLPSVILLVFHMVYYMNLYKFNEEVKLEIPATR